MILDKLRGARRYVVVVGCGRLGSYLASHISSEGHDVVVVDSRPAAFQELSAEFSGFSIEGDATEFGVLAKAGLDKADALVAATENDDVNLLVAQVGSRVFGVKRVLARMYDKDRQDLCRRLGIETVCPSCVVGDMFLEALFHADEEG